MMRALYVAVMALTVVGCATDVDDPVQQIPDPAPAKDPPAQTLSGNLQRPINDPYMQYLIDEARSGTPRDYAKQTPNLGLAGGAPIEPVK